MHEFTNRNMQLKLLLTHVPLIVNYKTIGAPIKHLRALLFKKFCFALCVTKIVNTINTKLLK